MSDVKRYQIGGRDIPASAAVFLPSEVVSSADYDALAAAHEQAWKSATSESHAWAREHEARMAVVAERDQLYAELRRVQAENQRLRGLQPEFPPRPPEGSGLPRYGLRWNGPQLPLSVPMDDGYWTPWHLAAQLHAELEAINGQQAVATPPTSSAEAITDTQRLDFILRKCRKVIVERLPNDYLEVYVEEGFMGETQHPVIAHRGDWAEASTEAAAVKRKAIDAAILWCETDGDAAKDGSA